MKLAIYGSGGSGQEIYDLAVRCNSGKWSDIVFVDDFETNDHKYLAKVIRFDALLENKNEFEVAISLGEPRARKDLFEKLKSCGINLTKLIDPTAIISPSASLGEGVVVFEYSIVHCGVRIGRNCLIQPYTGLGHGTIVGDHCVFSAHFSPAGGCQFGDCVFCGMHSFIKEGLKIGNNAVIAMGAGVFQDVQENSVVVGYPARLSIKNSSGKVFG